MHLHDPVWLDSLGDRAGRLRLEQLPDLLGRHDVVVGELLDEELRIAGAGPDPGPDPQWTPRLAELGADDQQTAHEVVYRHTVAFGLIDEMDDGTDVSPLLTVTSDEFDDAVAQLTWTHRGAGGHPVTWGMLLRPDGSVLHDEIDAANGSHLLALRSAERAVAAVVVALDVRPGADADGQHPDDGRHPDVGRPHPGGEAAIAATSIASCHLARAAVWDSTNPIRQVTTHADGDGQLWLIDQPDASTPPAEAVRADVPTLRRVAAELLRLEPS